jgi:hypothetical protein
MGEPRAKGLSLWLMPSGAAREDLAALIERLAARLGTAAFAPHVTLLPGLSGPEAETLARARALAGDLRPLPLVFSGIDGLDVPFRCLFFRAVASPELREAHARAAGHFDRPPEPAFDPHLSLVYGTLEATLKADLKRELAPKRPSPFEVRHLHVWKTEGPVGEWGERAVLELGTSAEV